MKRIGAILAAMLAALSISAAQDNTRLTLDDALRIGRERSHVLLASRARVDGAAARAEETHAAMLPSLKVDGSYKRLSDVPEYSISLPIAGFKSVVVFPMIADNYQFRATAQQPLFTGFKLSGASHAARLQAEAGELDVRNDEADVTVAISTAYWTLYQAEEVDSVARENVARLEMFEHDTQNLLRSGLATRNDLLRVQVQLQNSRLSAIDAENDLQVAGMNLNTLLGRPVDTPLLPASTPSVAEEGAIAPVDGSAMRRADVAALQTRVEASEASVTAARGGFFPQLFLSANYYYSKPNSRYMPLRNQWNDTWDVGLQLQFDVWNWGATSAQVEQARAVLQASKENLEALKESATLEANRARLMLSRSHEKIGVAQVGVSQAEENVRIVSDKYRTGLATSSDLLDANVGLLQAKTGLTGALVEHEIAKVRLAKALGQLN